MNKVLIITYYWPPSGGAGVQRWLKFSKYLPVFGWEPVVLTVDPAYASYPQIDNELVNEISPGLKVYKSVTSTGIFSAYKKITGSKEVPYGGFVNESNPGVVKKILRFIRGNFFLPDARVGWNRYALRSALRIIREEEITTVITSSPPHSTQLIGLKLKKRLKINWIADLRDPWSEIYYSGKMYQTLPARKINGFLESRVLNNADRVITTCNATRDLFRSVLKAGQPPDKIITVTNGYDQADFGKGAIVPDTFAITYLGTLAGSYDIGVLIRAIDMCKTKNHAPVTLRFIGRVDENTAALLRSNGNISTEFLPYVEHSKAMEYLVRSVALLIIIPSDKKSNEMIPGKLFEYMASRRPVIALGRYGSDVESILGETGSGRIFSETDEVDLAGYIDEIRDNFINGRFENNPVGIEKYSRENLAGQVAAVLNPV